MAASSHQSGEVAASVEAVTDVLDHLTATTHQVHRAIARRGLVGALPMPVRSAQDAVTEVVYGGVPYQSQVSAAEVGHLGLREVRLSREALERAEDGQVLSWLQVPDLPDWPGERPGEPSDLLGQGVPGRRDLGGCVEQPQAARSRPREGLGGLR